MNWRRLLSRHRPYRYSLKLLNRLVVAHEAQATHLQRLADHFCPTVLEIPPEELKVSTGISYSQDEEQGRILHFIEKVLADTGHEPTEQEIIDFLDGTPV